MIERRCEAGITIAARHDFRFRPDLEADLPQRATVFGCCATGKKNSSAIDSRRQFGKDRVQTLGRGEAKIRSLQFSLLQNTKFRAGCIGYHFYQYPGGFRAAAFHPEDALIGFHDSYCRAGVPPPASLFIIWQRRQAMRLPYKCALQLSS